jgi:hypothetical protein
MGLMGLMGLMGILFLRIPSIPVAQRPLYEVSRIIKLKAHSVFIYII